MRIAGRLITVSEEEKLLLWETASPVCVSVVCVRAVQRGLQRVFIRERRRERDGERERERGRERIT